MLFWSTPSAALTEAEEDDEEEAGVCVCVRTKNEQGGSCRLKLWEMDLYVQTTHNQDAVQLGL